MDAMNELGEESNVTMEDMVMEYFNSQTDDKNKLSVLNVRGIGAAVKNYIEKDDKEALKYVVDKAMEKAYNTLLDRGDDIDEGIDNLNVAGDDEKEIVKELESRERGRRVEESGARKGKQRDELFDSDEDMKVVDESDSDGSVEALPVKATRGRGRGRGARGATASTGRGRAAAKSPAKRGGRGRAPAQSTIAAAFARSQPAKQTQQSQAAASSSARPSQRNKRQMFQSDSDDDLLGAL